MKRENKGAPKVKKTRRRKSMDGMWDEGEKKREKDGSNSKILLPVATAGAADASCRLCVTTYKPLCLAL
jgi:hypothetical protein